MSLVQSQEFYIISKISEHRAPSRILYSLGTGKNHVPLALCNIWKYKDATVELYFIGTAPGPLVKNLIILTDY